MSARTEHYSVAKEDAFVSAIRQMARDSGTAHRPELRGTINAFRLAMDLYRLSGEPKGQIGLFWAHVRDLAKHGFPMDDLQATYTLLFEG